MASLIYLNTVYLKDLFEIELTPIRSFLEMIGLIRMSNSIRKRKLVILFKLYEQDYHIVKE